MIPDELIIKSLLSNNNIRDAAKALSISERTIYGRLRQPSFIQMYRDAKYTVLMQATRAFNERVSDVAEIMYRIACDDAVNAATRLQACQTIVNMACKFTDRANIAETEVITSVDPITTGLDNEIQKMLERSNDAIS